MKTLVFLELGPITRYLAGHPGLSPPFDPGNSSPFLITQREMTGPFIESKPGLAIVLVSISRATKGFSKALTPVLVAFLKQEVWIY